MRRTTVGPPARQSNAPSGHSFGVDRRSSAMPLTSNRRNSAMSSVSRAASSSTRRQTLSRKSDPRPLADRRFVEYSIQNLYAFLLDRGFQENISEKQLKSPTTKDFQNVFGFLVSLVTPFTWKSGKRLDEEVTTVLRGLQYPFSVSKSALSAVGSSHTWPALLGVLTWLMDLSKLGEPSFANAPYSTTSKANERRDIFRQQVAIGYSSFLVGEDDLPEQEAAVNNIFEERSANMRKEIEEMMESGKERQERLSQLRGNPSPLEQVLSYRRELESNIKKFNILIRSMLEHRESVKNKIEEKSDDMRQLTDAIENLTLEKRRDIEVIDSQRSQSIHAQQIANKRIELRKSIDDAVEEKNIIDESGAQERERMERVQDEAEILMRSYRHYFGQFASEVVECILQYDSRLNSQQPFPNLNEVLDELRKYWEKVEKELAAIQETVLKMDWETDVLEDKEKSMRQKKEEIRSALKRHEKEFEEMRLDSDSKQSKHNELLGTRKKEEVERKAAEVQSVKELEEKCSMFKKKKEEVVVQVEIKMNQAAKGVKKTRKQLTENKSRLIVRFGQMEGTTVDS